VNWDHPVLIAWIYMMLIALILALFGNGRPYKPFRTWLSDLFPKWGLAGILIWLVIHVFWGLRELMNMRLILPFGPLEGYLEYATYWGAVFTGILSIGFLGVAVLLAAIFDKPVVMNYTRARVWYLVAEEGYVSYREVEIGKSTAGAASASEGGRVETEKEGEKFIKLSQQ